MADTCIRACARTPFLDTIETFPKSVRCSTPYPVLLWGYFVSCRYFYTRGDFLVNTLSQINYYLARVCLLNPCLAQHRFHKWVHLYLYTTSLLQMVIYPLPPGSSRFHKRCCTSHWKLCTVSISNSASLPPPNRVTQGVYDYLAFVIPEPRDTRYFMVALGMIYTWTAWHTVNYKYLIDWGICG